MLVYRYIILAGTIKMTINSNITKEVKWIDICRKCGKQIFNGFLNPDNIDQVRNEMKLQGYEIGHKTSVVGTFGAIREVTIKPMCSTCLNEKNKSKIRKIKNE